MNPQDIVQKYDLDVDEFLRKAELISDTYGRLDGVVAGMRKADPFKQINTSAVQANQTIGQQVQVYQKVGAVVATYRKEQESLKKIITEIATEQKGFISAARYEELAKKIEVIQARLAALNTPLKEADSLWDKLKAKFSKGLDAKVTVKQTDAPATSNRGADGRFLPGSGSSGGGTSAGGGVGSLLGGKSDIKGTIAELTGLIGVTFGVAEAIKLTVSESAKFGKALSELSALTGVTGKDLEFLADAAVDLESKTGIASVDIVEAYKLVGGIKPELLESKEALAQVTEEVIALSQASGISLQDAATSAVGALNQFGEGADQAGRYVNVLAAGAKLGASEVADTAEALKNSGTAMKAAGVSFEQGNALLQILAKGMIKGSEAGTALRNILLKLETQSDKNLRPSIVGLDAALDGAAKKFDTSSEQVKIFGVENIVAAKQILAARGEVTEMTKALTGTQTAYEQQRTNLNNLSTDLSKAGTTTIGVFRDLGQSQDGFLRKIVQGYTLMLQQLTGKTSAFKAFITATFSGDSFNPIQATQNGFDAAFKQAEANRIAEAARTRVAGIKSASVQSVTDDTKALTDLYEKQGQTLPKAQKAAAEKVAAQRDEEYKAVVADHQRLRKEFEKADADERARLGKNEFEVSRQRQLAARTAKQTADSNLARLKKAASEQAAALKSALGEDPSDEEKKKGKELQKIREDTNKLLLGAQEEYVKEYVKIEAEFGKDRLEAMKRDAEGYILEKARLDKKEVDAQRDHLEKLLQLAASNQTKINKATGQREIVPNTSVKLSTDVIDAFNEKKKQIDAEADRQVRLVRIRREYEILQLARQSNQTELDLFDSFYEEKLLIEEKGAEKYAELVRQRDNARLDYVKRGNKDELNEYDAKWQGILASEEKNARKYAALVKKRDADRRDLVADQLIRDQKTTEQISLSNIAARKKGGNETGTAFNKRNELDSVATQIISAENQLFGLSEQNNPANAPEIARLEAYVKALKEKQKEIQQLSPKHRDIWDLLGVSTSFKDETERQLFLGAVEQIGKVVQEATQAIIQQSEARIQALDNEINAKQEQLSLEEERDKKGYANNLELRQKELQDLKRQKAEEQATRKKALAVQQALDIASVISTNATTVANLVASVALSFNKSIASTFNPLLGVIQAIAVIATIFATMTSVRAKASAISQLRHGGRARGPRHEQGGIRGTGAFGDIEIEGDEHVTNRESSDRYDKTLTALNKNDAQAALRHLLREGNIGLPSLIVQQLMQSDFGGPRADQDYSKLETLLGEQGDLLRLLVGNTKPGKQFTSLGEGWVLEQDGNKQTVRKINTP